jgi:hypothetical protein
MYGFDDPIHCPGITPTIFTLLKFQSQENFWNIGLGSRSWCQFLKSYSLLKRGYGSTPARPTEGRTAKDVSG